MCFLKVMVAGLLVAVSGIAWPSNIVGMVRDPRTNKPLDGVTVQACGEGRSACCAAVSDSDGRFEIPDLPPGYYAVYVGARDNFRPQIASVNVSTDAEAVVNFSLSPSVEVDGDSWLQGYPVFYQSFTASGTGVTSLRLKAFGPPHAVTVQVLEGEGPSGKPIGPRKKTVPFGGEGETNVLWSAGEVKTVPGNKYTLKLSTAAGETWVSGVAGRGDVYPGGHAYFGEEKRPFSDLGFTVCEENDNLTASYTVAVGRRAMLVRAVGQKFVARSANILYAAAMLAPAIPKAVYVRFSIHENGPGGPQIGPSKSAPVAGNVAVAWLPNEVPVTPGRSYYLHVESFDGSRFYAFEESDCYAKGAAFNDAVMDRRYDLSGWIVGEITDSELRKLFTHPKAIAPVPITNPSFEEGLSGWTLTKPIGAVVGCDGGVIPAWGSKMFGWTNKEKGEASRTIVYQMVEVREGAHYSFSASVYTDHIGGRSSDQKVRLVVNPFGLPEFTNEVMESSQWYATEGQWRRGSVEFVAKSAKIAVGFELEQRWSLELCSLYVDGAYLEEIAR